MKWGLVAGALEDCGQSTEGSPELAGAPRLGMLNTQFLLNSLVLLAAQPLNLRPWLL